MPHINQFAPELLTPILRLATTQLPFLDNLKDAYIPISEQCVQADLRDYANIHLVCKWWSETLGRQREFNLVGLSMMSKFLSAKLAQNVDVKAVKVLRLDPYGRKRMLNDQELALAGNFVDLISKACSEVEFLSLRLVDEKIWHKFFDCLPRRIIELMTRMGGLDKQTLEKLQEVKVLDKVKELVVEESGLPVSQLQSMFGNVGLPTYTLVWLLDQFYRVNILTLPLCYYQEEESVIETPMHLRHLTIPNLDIPDQFELELDTDSTCWTLFKSIVDSSLDTLTSLEIAIVSCPSLLRLGGESDAEHRDLSEDYYSRELMIALQDCASHLHRFEIGGIMRTWSSSEESPENPSTGFGCLAGLKHSFLEATLSLMTSLRDLTLPVDVVQPFSVLHLFNELRQLNLRWRISGITTQPVWTIANWQELLDTLGNRKHRVHVEIKVPISQNVQSEGQVASVMNSLGPDIWHQEMWEIFVVFQVSVEDRTEVDRQRLFGTEE